MLYTQSDLVYTLRNRDLYPIHHQLWRKIYMCCFAPGLRCQSRNGYGQVWEPAARRATPEVCHQLQCLLWEKKCMLWRSSTLLCGTFVWIEGSGVSIAHLASTFLKPQYDGVKKYLHSMHGFSTDCDRVGMKATRWAEQINKHTILSNILKQELNRDQTWLTQLGASVWIQTRVSGNCNDHLYSGLRMWIPGSRVFSITLGLDISISHHGGRRTPLSLGSTLSRKIAIAKYTSASTRRIIMQVWMLRTQR